MFKMNNNLYVSYFSTVYGNVSETKEDWVHVSSIKDDASAEAHINAFSINSNIRNFDNAFIIPKKTFEAVIMPVVNEVRDLITLHNEEYENFDSVEDDEIEGGLVNWILTDDEDYQWVRKMGNKWYRVLQIYATPNDKFYAGYVDVYLDDYLSPATESDAELINDILGGYGYDSFILGEDYDNEIEHYQLIIREIQEIYGDKYLQIVAECVAEFEGGPDDYLIEVKDATTREDAENIVRNFVKDSDYNV